MICALVVPAALAPSAGASSSCGTTGGFDSASNVCTYATPGTDSYTVPAGVTELTVATFGAEGGINGSNSGGAGGEAKATITVTPGETLQITVGAQGSGNTGGGYYYAGGGGGASDVRTGACAATLTCPLTSRIIVVGGGGGAGAFNYPYGGNTPGGAGGGVNGGSGTGLGGEGGGGTSSSGGGAGGSSGAGGAGTLGYGGAGAGSSVGQGGNGGDGYYGGGGGGTSTSLGGSGGGGSGCITSSALVAAFNTGVQNGNGEVVIGFVNATPTTPAISNLPASGVYGSSFTPSVATTGDGTTSVTSNSTGVCTVSGVVSYVGVGTCSLSAAVAAGADYTSATGLAQTFTVAAATPTTPSLVLRKNGSAVVVDFDLKAPVNTKVTIKIIRPGEPVKTLTTRVTNSHLIKYATGQLRHGTCKIEFVVGGKVIKITLVKVDK